ncbi:MAG: hypothetical protein OQJ99_11185, partial [Rhodospirillales bacterium]|nr:hypothetical protein [Rhodospirillales bacterium]
MVTYNLAELGEEFVIQFGVDAHEIEVDTLASSLISIARAIEIIADVCDPGTLVEVRIDALSDGTLRVRLKPIARRLLGATAGILGTLSLSILGTLIYDKMIKDPESITVHVDGNVVTIQHGETTVIIPIEAHNIKKKIDGN